MIEPPNQGSRGLALRALAMAVCVLSSVDARAQLSGPVLDPDHPAIRYDTGDASDPVARLQGRLRRRELKLTFDPQSGYLTSVLDALQIPIESQIAVYSKTSLQAPLIHPRNPRTIFCNDSVCVAWMRQGFIELAAHDSRQGATFYTLAQNAVPDPLPKRDDRCLSCHYSTATLGVPGFLVRSVPTAADGRVLPWLGNFVTDHTSPFAERWGGWYVTGEGDRLKHLGNRLLANQNAREQSIESSVLLKDLSAALDMSGYPTASSDVAALMVFDHQMRMMNILTRLGWEGRIALQAGKEVSSLEASVNDAVDYLLFIDEAPLPDVRATSGFAEKFTAVGPRDSKGRSLRQLRLKQRLFEYPCSYMIYSAAFANLPDQVRDAIYRRIWYVLSGSASQPKYLRLSRNDRQAVIDILRDTKSGLPAVFRSDLRR